MVQVSLRPFSRDDLPGLVALDREIQKRPWSETQFLEELEKPYSKVWVLTDDETDEVLVGYAVFWKIDEVLHLLTLGVAPAFRKQGFAQKIMRAMVGEGIREGATRALLEVRKSNTSAVSLYQRLGFTVDQIRKGFYSDGEDAYQMILHLDQNPYPEF